MPRSNRQRGSAVVEFVLLGIPALLLFGSGVTMFVNSYADTVLRAVAIDAARYVALADQNSNSADVYLSAKLKHVLPGVKVGYKFDRANTAGVNIQYQSLPSALSLIPKLVTIQAVAPIEK